MGRPQVRRGQSGRFALAKNWAILICTALALAVLLGVSNLVIFDHNVRWDLTPGKRFSLSRFDKRVLSGLGQNVTVIAFVNPSDSSYMRLAALLSEAAAFTPRLSYRIIDLNKSPALAHRYGVSTYGEAIVESRGRRRDFDSSRSDLLIPAILEVSHPTDKKICFTAGHGEGNLADTNRGSGYSRFANFLRQDGYQLNNVSLLAGKVPADTSVLVSLAPHANFRRRELDAIARYLARGGKFLVFLGPHASPDLAAFLKKYYLDFRRRIVVDPAFRIAQGEMLTMQIPIYSKTSPITRSIPLPPVFSMSRAVGVTGIPGEHAPEGLVFLHGKSLLESSRRSWASGDRKVVTTGMTEFESGRDIRGPIPVGSEVDFAPNGDLHVPVSKMARIVGFGGSAFVSNRFIDLPGNRDLAMNAVNELANEQILIAGRAHLGAKQSAAFYLTDAQTHGLFYLGAVLEPSLLFLVGIAIFVRRRFLA